MQFVAQPDVLGYVELKVGSQKVHVPIRVSKDDDEGSIVPMAIFSAVGTDYSILVDADAAAEPRTKEFHDAVHEAAVAAERHLSKKLLN